MALQFGSTKVGGLQFGFSVISEGWIWDGSWKQVYTSVPPTRIMTFANGGQGQTVAAVVTAGFSGGIGFRVPVKLWSDTLRWRLKLRNYDQTNVAGSNLTATGLIVGRHGGSGAFQGGVADTLVSGNFTIPGSGTFYTTGWVEASASQLEAGVEYLIGLHYNASWNTQIKTTIGQCFQSATGTNAIIPGNTAGLSVPSGIPIDIQIEYEVSQRTHESAWLIVGDSIQEGVQGPQGTTAASITPRPLWESPGQIWAEENGTLIQNISMAGAPGAVFANDDYPQLWSRQNLVDSKLDGALISVGSNDAFGGQTLAQFQATMATIVGKVRALIGEDAPLYLGTVMPRNALNTAQNNVRLAMNTWIRTLPLGVTGIVDFDEVMKSSANPNTQLNPAMTCDNIHPSYAGVAAMAAAMGSSIQL